MKGSIRKFTIIPLLVITYSLFVIRSAHAGTATANVNVQTNVNSSTKSTNESHVQTDIVIETNGERKEYHSDKPGNVSISSSDGKSSVSVSNDGESVSDTSSNSEKTSDQSITVNSGLSAGIAQVTDAESEDAFADLENQVIIPKIKTRENFFQAIFSIPQKIFKMFFR